ncbi:MAG: hypothetical protein K6E62_06285 [Lachnospiraceae bacterium]|nr:hypothetical protein [Lachnospiraceae bacterium]
MFADTRAERTGNRLFGACIRALILILLLCMTGCGKEPEEEGITTDFLEDTVAAVGTARISLAEWYLYAMPKVSSATALYGKDIWEYHISDDEGTIADAVKDDILKQIIYVKIVCSRAEKLGISLNEDELGDIETETLQYMDSLSAAQKEKYGITGEAVRNVYCDNLLAMKVYENLTLNIDTDIPDEEVRHTIIEYICANKYYENGDDGIERLSDEELSDLKIKMDELYERAVTDPEIKKLSQLENEQYAAIEMVTDYEGLKEKFSKELADKVFNMRESEIIGVFDTDDAFFIFDCVKRNDEEATDKAKVGIIERRQRELFEQEYAVWEDETIIKMNYPVWDSIVINDL